MQRLNWRRLATSSLLILLALPTGCADEEGVPTAGRPSTGGKGTSTANAVDATGSLGTESPWATPSFSPRPGPSPTLWVTSVLASPSTAVLYRPALDAGKTLGLPYSLQLSAVARRSNGTDGTVKWVNLSDRQLTLGLGGLVATTATTSPGIYFVRAEAVDDAAIGQDIAIEVRDTGQIDVKVD